MNLAQSQDFLQTGHKIELSQQISILSPLRGKVEGKLAGAPGSRSSSCHIKTPPLSGYLRLAIRLRKSRSYIINSFDFKT
jgi:hypothetical protein